MHIDLDPDAADLLAELAKLAVLLTAVGLAVILGWACKLLAEEMDD